MTPVTRILSAIHDGNAQAAEQLLQMWSRPPGHVARRVQPYFVGSAFTAASNSFSAAEA